MEQKKLFIAMAPIRVVYKEGNVELVESLNNDAKFGEETTLTPEAGKAFSKVQINPITLGENAVTITPSMTKDIVYDATKPESDDYDPAKPYWNKIKVQQIKLDDATVYATNVLENAYASLKKEMVYDPPNGKPYMTQVRIPQVELTPNPTSVELKENEDQLIKPTDEDDFKYYTSVTVPGIPVQENKDVHKADIVSDGEDDTTLEVTPDDDAKYLKKVTVEKIVPEKRTVEKQQLVSTGTTDTTLTIEPSAGKDYLTQVDIEKIKEETKSVEKSDLVTTSKTGGTHYVKPSTGNDYLKQVNIPKLIVQDLLTVTPKATAQTGMKPTGIDYVKQVNVEAAALEQKLAVDAEVNGTKAKEYTPSGNNIGFSKFSVNPIKVDESTDAYNTDLDEVQTIKPHTGYDYMTEVKVNPPAPEDITVESYVTGKTDTSQTFTATKATRKITVNPLNLVDGGEYTPSTSEDRVITQADLTEGYITSFKIKKVQGSEDVDATQLILDSQITGAPQVETRGENKYYSKVTVNPYTLRPAPQQVRQASETQDEIVKLSDVPNSANYDCLDTVKIPKLKVQEELEVDTNLTDENVSYTPENGNTYVKKITIKPPKTIETKQIDASLTGDVTKTIPANTFWNQIIVHPANMNDATVTEDKLAEGIIAYGKLGEKITGKMKDGSLPFFKEYETGTFTSDQLLNTGNLVNFSNAHSTYPALVICVPASTAQPIGSSGGATLARIYVCVQKFAAAFPVAIQDFVYDSLATGVRSTIYVYDGRIYAESVALHGTYNDGNDLRSYINQGYFRFEASNPAYYPLPTNYPYTWYAFWT